MEKVRKTSRQTAERLVALVALVGSAAVFLPAPAAKAELGRFDGYEIRVIRPRFMAKRNRFELGGELTTIMNQSFIYTFLATGLLDYHFSEMWAIEFEGAYGASLDKEDKRLLQDQFQINTQILRTQYIGTGGVLWTPIYGKTQLPSGNVVYFDSFVTAQGGMTGVQYTYEQCIVPTTAAAQQTANQSGYGQKPSPTVKSYPTLNLGFGQKYFVTQDWGLRWDVHDYVFPYNTADGSCTPGTGGKSDIHNNITLQLGASMFF